MKELLCEAIENMDESKALFIARKMIEAGVPKMEIINSVQKGLVKVGELFECREYYIADLMMVGILFKEILELEGMKDNNSTKDKDMGLMLLATVADDIHDLGKDIFGGLAHSAGFRVINLGVDVKCDMVVESIRKYDPDILGISGVMTYAPSEARKIILTLEQNNLREGIKIILGGAAFNNFNTVGLGADAVCRDAFEGVTISKKWMKEKYNH
ncbi:MAG: cobalamin B12-binding domain-containing protein [Eubacteriales bacterium]